MTPEDEQLITNIIDAAITTLTARQDRAVETIAGEISNLREEMKNRFNDTDRRLDRITEGVSVLQGHTINLNRWADRLDKDRAALGQNYFNQ